MTGTQLSTGERWAEGVGSTMSFIPIPGMKHVGKYGTDGAVNLWKRLDLQFFAGKRTGKIGWSMPKGGGVINGRKYSEHALERMAPNSHEVRAELTTRAIQKAAGKGLQSGTKEYYEFIKKYVDPRGITPSIVEDAIKNTPVKAGKYDGTFIHQNQNQNVTVIKNKNGDIVTVIPR